MMMKFVIGLAVVGLALAAPGRVQKTFEASVSASGDQGPISYENGNVGVNVAGFHASAGLGGLLTGDSTKGGLHAEAGTPFGHEAAAGLGGSVDANGHSGGALYAGATAGGGIAASSGIEGSAAYGHKTIHRQTQVLSEKTVTESPKVISEMTYQEAPVVHRTVIEKTVIPQYVEKTIQVPSYVEKTIRVPTVVEHKVRVPVTPKIVEKTYDEDTQVQKYAKPAASFHASFNSNVNGGAGVSGEKVALVERPTAVVHKQYSGPGLFGLFGGGFRAGAAGGFGASSAGGYAGSAHRQSFFNDVFN
ncbi:PREDICTED: uncharacterized protein LOC108562156 isoform X2 [Nicrophorus vespilloides]|nr:PREDICTED: uncharacterized protein LOC108562156 isoform X2 [Nicrophorus vespilloides]